MSEYYTTSLVKKLSQYDIPENGPSFSKTYYNSDLYCLNTLEFEGCYLILQLSVFTDVVSY